MKHCCLPTLIALVIASGLPAQQIRINGFAGFGPVQLSNFQETNNDFFGAAWSPSPLVGVNAEFYVKDRIALGAGFEYVVKGNTRYGRVTRYHYWQAPVLFRFDFYRNSQDNLLLYGRLGSYAALLLDQTDNGFQGPADIYLREYSSIRKVDLGLSVGVGASIQLYRRLSLSVELRADHGLLDVFYIPDCVGCTRDRAYNIGGWGMLGLSYLIPSAYEQGK